MTDAAVVRPAPTPGAAGPPDVSRRAGTRTTGRAASVLGAVLVLIAVTTVTWLRLAPTARDTLWAEDATRFLNEEEQYGLWGAIGRPYAGYLHAVPRLLAALVLQVSDLEALARTVTAVCCVVAGLVAAGITLLAAPHVRSLGVRVLMGLSVGLLPVVPAETAGNLANLHTYLLVLSPFLFLWTPRRRSSSAFAAVVAALIAFTEIQTALFLPLLLLGRRDRLRWPMGVAAVLGVVAQVVTTLSHPRPRPPYHVSAGEIAYGYLTMPLPQAFSSHTGPVFRLATEHRPAYLVVTVLLLLAVAALVVLRCRGRQRALGVALLLGSVVTWAAALLLNTRPNFAFTTWTAADYADFSLARYATVSALLLVLALLVLADALLGGRVTRVVAGALVLALVVGWLGGLQVPSIRQAGPELPPQVPALVARCDAAPAGTIVRVSAAPPARSPWSLPLRCAEVLARTGH